MQRVRHSCASAAFKASRSYSHAASLGDGITPELKLTPANKVKLPNGNVVVSEGHLDTSLHTSKLDNGTRVISKDNGGNIARLTFLYKDGPVYESMFSSGASQFTKHLLNKDSLTSSEFVSKTILQKAGVRIEFPQLINKSWIAFSVEGFRDTIAQTEVCDKFWQSLLFPRFSQANLKEAKRLIHLENDELKRDTPRDYVLNQLHGVAFKGSPLGQTIACPSANLKYFKVDHMFDRWDAHYGFGNIAVVATNIDHHDLLHSVQDSTWVARHVHVRVIPSAHMPPQFHP
jgi:predicted Zn-dependent peptidase